MHILFYENQPKELMILTVIDICSFRFQRDSIVLLLLRRSLKKDKLRFNISIIYTPSFALITGSSADAGILLLKSLLRPTPARNTLPLAICFDSIAPFSN